MKSLKGNRTQATRHAASQFIDLIILSANVQICRLEMDHYLQEYSNFIFENYFFRSYSTDFFQINCIQIAEKRSFRVYNHFFLNPHTFYPSAKKPKGYCNEHVRPSLPPSVNFSVFSQCRPHFFT